jgi:putative hydrolase of the HAD superfamily
MMARLVTGSTAVVREGGTSLPPATRIRAIVFDLDGTLYVSDEFAAVIKDAAVAYLAALLGLDREQARTAMAETRDRLTAESGAQPTLSAVCRAVGGTLPGMHEFFQQRLRPESYLVPDRRVIDLLDRLRCQAALYIYTNNSRPLVNRILVALGLEGLFRGVFTIDDSWRAKPDQGGLEQVLAIVAEPAEGVLFVGDRFDVDLCLAKRNGCPVFLCRTIEDLLQLDRLIVSRQG